MNYRYFGVLHDGIICPSSSIYWYRHDSDTQEAVWVYDDGSVHSQSYITLQQMLGMPNTVEATHRFVPEYLRVSEGL